MELLEEKYNTAIKDIIDIYDIFIDYFGEDYVDLQNLPKKSMFTNDSSVDAIRTAIRDVFILVWFPEVIITNEFDKSHIIKDLFAKIPLNREGKLNTWMSLNRATYTLSEIRGDYMHSHIDGINFRDSEYFKSPCLGNGPIKRTSESLMVSNDLDLWQLYCVELDNYVKVESLAGIPWRKMENLDSSSLYSLREIEYPNYIVSPVRLKCLLAGELNLIASNSYRNLLNDFIIHCIKSRLLNITFDGYFKPAYSQNELVIILSNAFIKWFNIRNNPYNKIFNSTTLIREGILKNIIIKDSCFYESSEIRYSRTSLAKDASIETLKASFSSVVCKFKDNYVYRIIEDLDSINSSEVTNYSLLLSSDTITYLLSKILFIINYGYTANYSNTTIKDFGFYY